MLGECVCEYIRVSVSAYVLSMSGIGQELHGAPQSLREASRGELHGFRLPAGEATVESLSRASDASSTVQLKTLLRAAAGLARPGFPPGEGRTRIYFCNKGGELGSPEEARAGVRPRKAQAAPCVLAPSCPVRGAGAATAPGTGLPPSDPTPHLLLLSVGPSSLRAQTAWAAAGEPPGCQSPARGWPAAAAHSGPGPLELTKPPLDGRAGGTGAPSVNTNGASERKESGDSSSFAPPSPPPPKGESGLGPCPGTGPLAGELGPGGASLLVNH